MVIMNDPIGDLLTRMRNAQAARHVQCAIPWSEKKHILCTVLKAKGWIGEVKVQGEGKTKEILVIFSPEHPHLTLTRVSTPGRRVYKSAKELRPVLRGFGMAILTTNQGILCDRDARTKNVGGEILCTVS